MSSTSATHVSVIIPVHNGAVFYDSALDSILLQDSPCPEIVIVDDGSTDDLSERIVRRGVAVRLLRQARRGPASARNAGIRAASGDLIAFLDIDDRWAPGHLANLGRALRDDPGSGIAQGLMRQFSLLPDGRYRMSAPYRMPYLGACLFRREVLVNRGYFDETMPMGEDYDLLYRCWEHDTPKRCVNHVCLLYRRHEANLTRGRAREANLRVLQRRLQRVRSGAVDPASPRRFAFADYIGDIAGLSDPLVMTADACGL